MTKKDIVVLFVLILIAQIIAPYIRDLIVITITGDFVRGMFVGFYEDSLIVTFGMRLHHARHWILLLIVLVAWLRWLLSRRDRSLMQILLRKERESYIPF